MKTLEELLDLQWNGSKSMVKHCLDSSAYIELDGRYVDCGSKKPGISSEIYYDDETPAPKINFETFKHHNEQNIPQPLVMEKSVFGNRSYLYIAPQYNGDKTEGTLCGIRYESEHFIDGKGVTEEELVIINKRRAELAADYEKRLERYWKRYGDKVRTHGYWANR